jgi:hypothetical protein
MSFASRWRRGVLLTTLGLVLGCSGRTLRADARPHGNFAAIVTSSFTEQREDRGAPLAVLFGEAEAVAIDLETGDPRWRRPLRVLGAPSVRGRRVAVPVRGHRVQLLDVDTGATLWERHLSGEAVTGVALGERHLLVTVVTGEADPRSLAVALSTGDGRRRWTRSSSVLLGVPAALGRRMFVPSRDEVVVLTPSLGREVARMRVPAEAGALGRIEVQGRQLLAAGAHAFVDLHAGRDAVYRLAPQAFRVVEGLDPGLGFGDGVVWRLRPSPSAGAPREAVLMARRVALAVRLDADGRPVLARWVHHQDDARELVAVELDRRTVTFVRQDGSIVRMDLHDGHVVSDFAGRGATLGAVIVGEPLPLAATVHRPVDEATEAALLAVLEDPDPRLVPAQRLVVELLWRHERPAVRTTLRDLVLGGLRPGSDDVSDSLRTHARVVMRGPWGPADEALSNELARGLSAARDGNRDRDDVGELAQRVVRSGTPAMLETLVALLDQPGVTPDELVALTRALRELDDPRAVPGLATFVLRYHADPEIVEESDAMLHALDYLVSQARDDAFDPSASDHAREVLMKLTDDRFTVPRLRAFLRERGLG